MSKWIRCASKTPPEGVPVWLWDGSRCWIGSYAYEDGWFYGHAYGSQFWDCPTGRWRAFDNEIDDEYLPTHWMHLPEPPAPRGKALRGEGK